MANQQPKFKTGDKVIVPGTKDAVILWIIKGGKNPMYQIEYTVDDDIAREREAEGETNRRSSQPRFETELKMVE